MIDAIIPTIRGREGSLARLLDSLERTVETGLHTIVVRDSESCGWGWLEGLKESSAPYVLLACDDQEFTFPGWDRVCRETCEDELLPCPRVWNPLGGVESQGGDMHRRHHLDRRRRRDLEPCDYTTVPFLSRRQIDRIGMLAVHYASDVWVSYRGRQLGWRTVLRHGFEVTHHQEALGRGAGMPQADRDRQDCATVFEALGEVERV